MKRYFLKYGLIIYLSLITGVVSATPIVDFTGGSTTYAGGDFSFGYTFSVTSALTIDGLSWWDEAGDGLVSDHEVGLWASDGTLLASTTVTNSSAAESSISGFGNWMVESIAAMTLGIGDYVVGGVQTNSIGGDLIRILATASSVSGVVYGGAVQNVGNGLSLTMPDQLVPYVNDGAWGPNVHLASVPEPGTLALIGIGLAGLGFSRKKKSAQV